MVDSRLSIVKRLLARGLNCLESGFDGNLELPRAALVVKRACIPEALVEHLGGLAEEQVRKRRIDIPEIGMIENVEGLDFQLHVQSLAKLIGLPDAKVPLHLREPTKKISWRVSRGWCFRQRQSRVECVQAAIEHAAPRILRTVQVQRPARNQIYSAVIGSSGHGVERKIPQQIHRKPCSCDQPGIESPPFRKPLHT